MIEIRDFFTQSEKLSRKSFNINEPVFMGKR